MEWFDTRFDTISKRFRQNCDPKIVSKLASITEIKSYIPGYRVEKYSLLEI